MLPLQDNKLNLHAIKYFLSQKKIDLRQIENLENISSKFILGFNEGHFFTGEHTLDESWKIFNFSSNVR